MSGFIALYTGDRQYRCLSVGCLFIAAGCRISRVRERPSVPFIGDDIMESFDDFRAEETLKLFTKMAGVGQVIYFTHHRHLIPIARETCPTIMVHELTAAERSAA